MEAIDPMVYYRDPSNNEVCGWDVRTQQEQIDQAIAEGFTLVPVWPLPPTGQEALDICKSEASNLLYATDWTTIADVADPANSPYLTNQAEFIAYRNIIRGYAVNPVEAPVFPVVPTAGQQYKRKQHDTRNRTVPKNEVGIRNCGCKFYFGIIR